MRLRNQRDDSDIRTWRSAVREAAGLLLLAAVLAFGSNAIRKDGIPIWHFGNPRATDVAKQENSGRITLERAKDLFRLEKAQFVDARSEADFHVGHISGAISLPLNEIESGMERFIVETDPKAVIVTYCSGDDCRLSEKLAKIIRTWGYENVYFITVTLSEWQQAGLPVETSGDG